MAAENNTTAEAEKTVYDDSMSAAELKNIAKAKGITGYSSMKKEQLLEVLNSGN